MRSLTSFSFIIGSYALPLAAAIPSLVSRSCLTSFKRPRWYPGPEPNQATAITLQHAEHSGVSFRGPVGYDALRNVEGA